MEIWMLVGLCIGSALLVWIIYCTLFGCNSNDHNHNHYNHPNNYGHSIKGDNKEDNNKVNCVEGNCFPSKEESNMIETIPKLEVDGNKCDSNGVCENTMENSNPNN